MPIKGQFPAVIQLSSLNGNNGFELNGVAAGDYSGCSVGTAGDVNHDGIQDIIIGAYDASPGGLLNAGKTYVVFGKTSWTSPISLSMLNGTTGLELDGGAASDVSGYSVATAGDVNGDGLSDIIIGAYAASPGGLSAAGKTYVVFGRTSWTSPISLSMLNGTTGFELDGGAAGDNSGISVAAAGDVNGDGLSDIIIGAYQASPGGLSHAGKTYVVFGKTSWTSPISLSMLNGTTGFELDGVAASDASGVSVATARDVNGDGLSDIIIGAWGASPGGLTNAGKTYVVFGRTSWTSPISLSRLNGTTGFELDGGAAGDYSGYSVATAGDVNGDGIQDIIIGAFAASPGGLTNAGKTYVVFGKAHWTTSFFLNSTNGVNGFELDGAAAGDCSGASVATSGDVNGDGISDIIIGAWGASPGGKTYVVFGDSLPVLVSNNLNIARSQIVILNSSMIFAYDLNHNNNSLLFVPSNVTGGRFEMRSNPGIALTSFNQSQVVAGAIQFVQDGSPTAPSYNISVTTTGFAFVPPNPANISFSLAQVTGTPTFAPTVVTSSILPTLSPTLINTNSPTSSIPTAYPIAVPSMTQTLLPSASPTTIPTITPTIAPTPNNALPRFLQNSLTLSNGQTITLTSSNLQATETNFNDSQLIFTVSNLQQGGFYRMPANVTTYSFPQSHIEQSRIQFRHNGDNIAPAYSVIVSDGISATAPNAATINFQGAPTVQLNPLSITQGQIITLTTQNINVTASGVPPTQVILQVQNLQHATLTSTLTGLPVSSFTLAALQAGTIQLQQDGSTNAPSFTVTATTPTGSSAPIAPPISFSAQGVNAPMLANNFLTITEGQTAILTFQDLSATQNAQTVADSARFYVTNIQNGYFSLTNNPVQISSFTQLQLRQGLVQFTHDGSSNIPSYQISVAANGVQSASLPVGVFFTAINHPPQLIRPLADQKVTVGQSFTFAIQDAFVDPQNEPITLSATAANSSFLPQWLTFNPSEQRFIGNALASGLTDIEVTATDVDGLSTQDHFFINAENAAPANAPYLEKTLISAGVSGGVGLAFYLFKLGLKRAADKKILESLKLNQEDFDKNVVSPIAAAISKRVKITGFSGISENTLEEFKGAVRTLIAELGQRGIDFEFDKIKADKRDELINEIATQTKLYLSEKRSCGKALCSFFGAEASPEDIRKAAPTIADRVANKIGQRKASQIAMSPLSTASEPDGLDLQMKRESRTSLGL